MIDLSDLGIVPAPSAARDVTPTNDGHASGGDPRRLVVGSALARVLYEVWTGTPTVLVDSAPGAGKSTLIVDVIAHLATRTDLTITLACPTKHGAYDVTGRLLRRLEEFEPMPEKRPGVRFAVNGLSGPVGSANVDDEASVTVRTVASCAIKPPECAVMVFDEAYQVTYTDAVNAADFAEQVVMVGDPGQIGPVVTVDTRMWDGVTVSPHARAPEMFARQPDAKVFRLGDTYRFGAASAAAIAPLYDFAFGTSAPQRTVHDTQGQAIAEISHMLLPDDVTRAELDAMRPVAELAASRIGSTVNAVQADGEKSVHVADDEDITIVAPHNDQIVALRSLLDSAGHSGITVGTADSLQGGQWLIVIAVDPIVGHENLSEFQLHEGRLCVMASRHMAALTWVTVPAWEDRLRAYQDKHPVRVANGIAVRRALIGST